MRKIEKNAPPESFRKWVSIKPRNKNENQWFQELYKKEKWDVVSDLAKSSSIEQFFICAYCCDRIEGKSQDTVNEHVESRRIAPGRSLDYTNIVASCKNKGRCDNSHGGQALPLTPLMDECETELRFKISGRVEGLSKRAEEAIKVLNLGDSENMNKSLIEKRKQLSNNLLWKNGINPDEGLEDDELLQSVIEELINPDNGRLEPFAPVVVNILQNWMATHKN